jgi:HK97 gp10 family phage protein
MAQAHDLIEEFAETMADRARDLAPPPPKFGTDTATGHNRDSINFEMTGETKARVFTESGYGGWLEIGTTKMAARPYFRPAFEATRKELNG